MDEISRDIIDSTVRYIRKARHQATGFWGLLTDTFDCYITYPNVPLEETIPLLRQLTDMHWTGKGRGYSERYEAVRSLLYYALDRAREVQDLRTELAAAKQQLAMLQRGFTPVTWLH